MYKIITQQKKINKRYNKESRQALDIERGFMEEKGYTFDHDYQLQRDCDMNRDYSLSGQ